MSNTRRTDRFLIDQFNRGQTQAEEMVGTTTAAQAAAVQGSSVSSEIR